MDLKDFINKWEGLTYDDDGYYGYQCKDITNLYTREVWGIESPRGNAYEVYDMDWGEKVEKIRNTPEFLPLPGDLCIWNMGTYGHIGIVVEATLDSMTILDQNTGSGNGDGEGNNIIRIHRYTYNNVHGFIRLKTPPMATFGPHRNKNGYTFPSSIYGVPIVFRRTSDKRLLAISNTKGYEGATKTIIYITENLLAKGYDRTIKTIWHEFQHILQHSTYTAEQIKYTEDIFDIVKEECFPSGYSKTDFWEFEAEIIGWGLGYIEKDLDMPLGKQWTKETQIVFNMFYKLHKNSLHKYLLN